MAQLRPVPKFSDNRYNVWLAEVRIARESWIHGMGSLRGLCNPIAHFMARTFPELTVTKGWVHTTEPPFGQSPHWWCKLSDGTIIDPTACQFGCPSADAYEEYSAAEHGELPSGKCMNCGDRCYGDYTGVCSIECGDELRADLEEPRSRLVL